MAVAGESSGGGGSKRSSGFTAVHGGQAFPFSPSARAPDTRSRPPSRASLLHVRPPAWLRRLVGRLLRSRRSSETRRRIEARRQYSTDGTRAAHNPYPEEDFDIYYSAKLGDSYRGESTEPAPPDRACAAHPPTPELLTAGMIVTEQGELLTFQQMCLLGYARLPPDDPAATSHAGCCFAQCGSSQSSTQQGSQQGSSHAGGHFGASKHGGSSHGGSHFGGGSQFGGGSSHHGGSHFGEAQAAPGRV